MDISLLAICQSMDIWVVLLFVMIIATKNICALFFGCGHTFSFLPSIFRVEGQGHVLSLCLVYWGNAWFPEGCTGSHSLQERMKVFPDLASTLWLSFYGSTSTWVWGSIRWDSDVQFPGSGILSLSLVFVASHKLLLEENRPFLLKELPAYIPDSFFE